MKKVRTIKSISFHGFSKILINEELYTEEEFERFKKKCTKGWNIE